MAAKSQVTFFGGLAFGVSLELSFVISFDQLEGEKELELSSVNRPLEARL